VNVNIVVTKIEGLLMNSQNEIYIFSKSSVVTVIKLQSIINRVSRNKIVWLRPS
jgi:hypothetical protein